MRDYTHWSPELRREGGRWRADWRTMHMESRGPEQLLASNPGLGLKKKRLKVDWGGSFSWTVAFSVDFTGAGGTHGKMVLEGNSSPPADQNSLPGGAPSVTSMRTPDRSHSVRTSRARSRCYFRLMAVTQVATKWYPNIRKDSERHLVNAEAMFSLQKKKKKRRQAQTSDVFWKEERLLSRSNSL